MNIRIARWVAIHLILVGIILSGGCEKTVARIPANEVFVKFRKELDKIKDLEEKRIRPAALIQISTEGDFTRYLTGNGLETVADSWRPYPNRDVLKQYQAITQRIGAHYIEFGTEGEFRVVFMNGPYAPPQEDGLIYQPDPDAIRPASFPYKVDYLGDGWYSYDRQKKAKL